GFAAPYFVTDTTDFRFNVPGVYVMRFNLFSTDSLVSDDVTYIVTTGPSIVSAPMATPTLVVLPQTTRLAVYASDDGVPAALTYHWSLKAGPAAAQIAADPVSNGSAATV